MEYFNLDVSKIQERCKERGDIKHVRFPIRCVPVARDDRINLISFPICIVVVFVHTRGSCHNQSLSLSGSRAALTDSMDLLQGL